MAVETVEAGMHHGTPRSTSKYLTRSTRRIEFDQIDREIVEEMEDRAFLRHAELDLFYDPDFLGDDLDFLFFVEAEEMHFYPFEPNLFSVPSFERDDVSFTSNHYDC